MARDVLEQIGKLIKAELEPVHTRLAGIEKGQQEIMTAVQQLTEDMTDFFHETWKTMGKTDQRVSEIEDHLDIPHPHNN